MRNSPGLAVLVLLLLQTGGALGFEILPGDSDSLNHPTITERAILNATLQVCQNLALAAGRHFTLPRQQPFTAEAVIVACSSPKSSKTFRQAIKLIKWRNVRVDLRHALNESYHFDAESFTVGRRIITNGVSAVKANNKRGNFEAARQMLGEILHPLQDFYSHSNWVELGYKLPNSNLIRSDTSIGNIADENRATCRNCDGDDCRNNILEDIIQEKVLTSGYFGIVPFFSTKPKGKCSHGGPVDRTSGIEPEGGINKDKRTASHGHLHSEAANLAIAATRELLEDIHAAAGHTDFLQLMGISKGSNKALCFVIDTTPSMRDEIEAVKTVTSSLIDSKVGTQDEPSLYILVPFRDPDFGPLMRTTDPNIFKTLINALTLQGGNNDSAEMSLSGLQLALTGAPPNSEIFLFTDATAKDSHLKSTVTALIERTKTVVNFMLTGVFGLRRRRRSDNGVQMAHMIRTGTSGAQIYRDLAQASGGHAIEVTKSELLEATSIITESSASSLVTLLQAARTPGRPDNFTFSVDESVTNLIIYITGRSMSFTLINPSGVSQSSADTTGPLGSIQAVGNFRTMRLNKYVGSWEIRMVSTQPYSLKVIGQSDIDFLFDFVELAQSTFKGYDVLETRPRAGVNGSLLVTVTGSDSAAVTGVSLVETSGAGEVSGSVTLQEDGDYLVQVDRVPSTEFVVRVKGRLDSSRESRESRASDVDFQRQSATNLKASSLTVTADSDGILEPGTPFLVPFTVATNGTGGNVTIRATNDRGFNSTSPTSILLTNGVSANGTVTLMAPLNTPSGSDVTLTIEAEAPGGTDTNYAVLLISIVNTVTDFTRPVCQLAALQSECSESNCSTSAWRLSASVSDGPQGTGVERVSLKQGNGTLNTSVAVSVVDNQNVTLVSYSASCCSPDVELQVVDEVGNVGSCFYTARETATTEAPTTTSSLPHPVTPAALAMATRASQPSYLCLNMAITLTLAPLLAP